MQRFGSLCCMTDRGDAALGRRLKELRGQAKMSQVDVAAAVGKSRGHISAIETGKRPIGRETLMALADLYGTSLDFIAARMGEAGGSTVKNEFEAAWLMVGRELPRDEAMGLLQALMLRLRDRLKTS